MTWLDLQLVAAGDDWCCCHQVLKSLFPSLSSLPPRQRVQLLYATLPAAVLLLLVCTRLDESREESRKRKKHCPPENSSWEFLARLARRTRSSFLRPPPSAWDARAGSKLYSPRESLTLSYNIQYYQLALHIYLLWTKVSSGSSRRRNQQQQLSPPQFQRGERKRETTAAFLISP